MSDSELKYWEIQGREHRNRMDSEIRRWRHTDAWGGAIHFIIAGACIMAIVTAGNVGTVIFMGLWATVSIWLGWEDATGRTREITRRRRGVSPVARDLAQSNAEDRDENPGNLIRKRIQRSHELRRKYGAGGNHG